LHRVIEPLYVVAGPLYTATSILHIDFGPLHGENGKQQAVFITLHAVNG
jgi:hypothetical protein